MKIVKFKNGKYGIRRWSLWSMGYEFNDLVSGGYLWSKVTDSMNSCQESDLQIVRKIFQNITDKGTPVKEKEEEQNTALATELSITKDKFEQARKLYLEATNRAMRAEKELARQMQGGELAQKRGTKCTETESI